MLHGKGPPSLSLRLFHLLQSPLGCSHETHQVPLHVLIGESYPVGAGG
jgi:hypothetical protein